VIELWHEWNSVHSFKVRVVLNEKKLAWAERRIELLKFEHLSPQYLKLNPNGVVPTLVHEGRVILESSVICQYLDEAFPEPPLLPPEPSNRARARAWLEYFDDIVHPALRAASFELLYRPQLAAMPHAELASRLAAHPDASRARRFAEAATNGVDSNALSTAEETFKAVACKVDAALDGEWLSGMQFGLADVAMAPFAERIAHLDLAAIWDPCPRARRWVAAILSRTSVIRSRAPREYRFILGNPI
jgi:glutathione S-transferase